MNDIGPGDWVECVNGDIECLGFRHGSIYQVSALRTMARSCHACALCQRVGVSLVGMPFEKAGYRAGWVCASAFRPIYRPRESLIRELLAPIPAEPVSA